MWLVPNCPEESFDRPLPNLIKDCGSLSVMQNVATMHSEDVVDPAYGQFFSEEGKFCLLALTAAPVHGPDDICFCQELVCDTPEGSHCNSECDISVSCSTIG